VKHLPLLPRRDRIVGGVGVCVHHAGIGKLFGIPEVLLLAASTKGLTLPKIVR